MTTRPRTQRGFTLIELMTVVAVVGILSAIAYPSYVEHIRKSRRTDAKNALLDLASRQERYLTVHNTYAGTLTDLGYADNTGQVLTGGRSYYLITLKQNNAQDYTATASPDVSTDQTRDTTCYAYTINQLGVQNNVGPDDKPLNGAGKCW